MRRIVLLNLIHTLWAANFAWAAQPTELQAFVQAAQIRYTQGYAEAYKAWCKEKNGNCVAELLVRPNGMNVPDPYALLRIDMVSNLNGKFEAARYEPDLSSMGSPKTLSFSPRLAVTLSPIVWSRVEFMCLQKPSDLAQLTQWANKWIDPTDSKPPSKSGFSGVIHSITYPAAQSGGTRVLVNFGSSGPEAFYELLHALEATGIQNVQIQSSIHVQ